jgi:hypothetical protein
MGNIEIAILLLKRDDIDLGIKVSVVHFFFFFFFHPDTD